MFALAHLQGLTALPKLTGLPSAMSLVLSKLELEVAQNKGVTRQMSAINNQDGCKTSSPSLEIQQVFLPWALPQFPSCPLPQFA
jgi:hypothetical protein